ncbi:cation diffusion facilitator family transporter [Kribbella sp. WER1]
MRFIHPSDGTGKRIGSAALVTDGLHASTDGFTSLAVDPALVDRAEQVIRSTPGVVDVRDVQLRWLGHNRRAEARISVDTNTSLVDAHHLSHQVEHALVQGVRRLTSATIHTEPLAPEATAATNWLPITTDRRQSRLGSPEPQTPRARFASL